MTLLNKLLNELKTNEEARDRLNSLTPNIDCWLDGDNCLFTIGDQYWNAIDILDMIRFENLGQDFKKIIIMAMLSKGVMEFLDRDITRDNGNGFVYEDNLGEHLYHEFTEALRVHKPVDEAINIIEEIYAEYDS